MKTRPNHTGIRGIERHILDIPPCCPVSGNPLLGSTITIIYRPQAVVLDVIPLPSYIRQFVGGLRGKDGMIEVRDMEAMIQRIASDCCAALGVAVRVSAFLVLWPHDQRMIIKARAY